MLDAEPGEEPDQVLGGEVAGRALRVGAAAEAAGARVVRRDAGAQAGLDVGQRLAVGVVEVQREVADAASRPRRTASTSAVTWPAVPTPMVSPRLSCERAEVEQPLPDRDHLLDRDGALPRVAEAHRDVGADVEAGVAGAAYDGLEHRELLVERPVEVLLRERLGRAAEDRDVAAAELERAVEAALVGHQHRAAHGPTSPSIAHQVLGVGELRAPTRVDERWSPRRSAAGREQPPDQLGLHLGRDQRRLVLEPVARSDLVDRDALGQVRRPDGHRQLAHAPPPPARRARPRTASRRAPPGHRRRRRRRTTVPANGAFSDSSIFIASIMPSTWPSSTRSPSATRTSSTVPGIGATTRAVADGRRGRRAGRVR